MREIETKRLLLRKLRSDDAESVFRNWASDSEVAKYVTWNVHKDINETKAILDMWLAEYDNDNCYRYGIENKAAGEKFLAENAKKEGVKTTSSGLQYKIIKEGNGAVPTDSSKVKVNYKGTLIDGTQFDSSYDRKEPTTFRANQVIKGWTEALTMMPVGSKWELYIPQDLAYGAREAGQIKPFSTLIFEVELVGIEK